MVKEDLVFKAAWYYYMEGMTQQQVSETLGISRMKVVSYLDQARQDGLVQFKVRSEQGHRMQLEKDMMEKFGLDDVYIVPTSPDDINKSVAKAAAQYLNDKLKDNDYINIGYGETISHTLHYLLSYLDKKVSFISLAGGVSVYAKSLIGSTPLNGVNSSVNIHLIPAPLIMSSKELAKALCAEKSVKNIIDMTTSSEYTLIGIGALSKAATIYREGHITETDLHLLERKGAIGDILSQFYDKDGHILDVDLHDRLISVRLEKLKEKKNVIGVAGGQTKVNAIHAAIKAKIVNILITDEDTAKDLLHHEMEV